MRKYISYILFAIAAAFMTGCLNVEVSPIEPSQPAKVTLHLKNADLVATRATTSDDEYNEDLIQSVQCFFAKSGSDAVMHATDLITVGANQSSQVDVELNAGLVAELFGNGTSCDVYVVANYGSKIEDNSIAAIKAKGITLSTEAQQESFVMDGKATVSLSGTALSGTVNLTRAAAKIIVKVKIDNTVTEGGYTWTPQVAGIKMTYSGSVNASKISATAADANTTATYTQQTNVFTKDDATSNDALYVGYQTVPFYSFPVSSAANKGEISMIIPWAPNNGKAVEYAYQIPVDIAFERNHVYLLEVNVGMLGNASGAILTPSYTIVDWTANPITAGLSRPKYLVVDENNVVMNNVNSYAVGYASSDDVTAVITKITKPDYSQEEIGTTTIYSNNNGSATVTPTSGNKESFRVVLQDNKVVLSHILNNDNTSSGYDYVPYSITVKVSSGSFTETITYTQYPAMYIAAQKNPGGNKLTNNGYDKGHVFVYGNQNENVSDWNTVRSCEQGGNNNPNMYIITTTALDSGSSYVLADSRAQSSVTGSSLGLSNSFNNKSLSKYYASRSDNDNYLSPQFRIASSYGKCGSAISSSDAKKRCAAYQEYGYPAGRWRVPTTAEMKYIAMISSKGWIPHLFSNSSSYWSSTEKITYSNSGTVTESNSTSGNAYVRCVYDEWYWTDKCDLKTFTWGD